MAEEEKQDNKSSSNELSLSEALLAPLDSIFKAQVHAARSFINFVLQMGFRHKYTKEDIIKLRNEPTQENQEILRKIEEEEDKTKRKKELQKKLNQEGGLSYEEFNEFRSLQAELGDIYQQTFNYTDQNGNEMQVCIPNLALLPIRPLAIEDANFKYELRVTDTSKEFDQLRETVKGHAKERPWFLIQHPRTITGEFAPYKENSTDRTIKIEVNVKATDMPYGLEKLLTYFTNNIEVIDKKEDF